MISCASGSKADIKTMKSFTDAGWKEPAVPNWKHKYYSKTFSFGKTEIFTKNAFFYMGTTLLFLSVFATALSYRQHREISVR